MRAATEAVCAAPWAIEEPALRTILEIAEGRGVDLDAVEQRRGDPLANTRRVTVRDGVAVVPVTGPIFRRANLFTAISGATSIDVLARDLREAADNDQVRAILLDIDSPGGQVNGTNELAKMVRGIRDGGEKPVAAYVGGTGASGAYWIASAAGHVFADETALLGSIGVVMAGTHTKRPGEFEIVSSQSPDKRLDPTSEEGGARLQAHVDAMAEVFIAAVAANRGVSPDQVKADFGRGGVLLGAAAVEAGMADGIASHEEVIARLAAGDFAGPRRLHFINRKERDMSGNNQVTLTADAVARDYPDIAAALRAEGRQEAIAANDAAVSAARDEGRKAGSAEAVAAERARILALEEAALPGFDDLLAAAKADGSTAEVLAMRIVATQKALGGTALAAAAGDAAATASNLPAPGAAADGSGAAVKPKGRDEAAMTEDELKAHYEGSAALQEEFGAFATYAAFVKGQKAGAFKIREPRK